MPFDATTLPIAPMTLVAGALAAVTSGFLLGPEVIHRENETTAWYARCEAELAEDIQVTRIPQVVVPNVGDVCEGMFRDLPEYSAFCEFIPDIPNPQTEAERLRREAEDARIARVLEWTGSTCSCAEAQFVANNRWQIAAYVLSGRSVELPQIQDREAGLSRAMRSATCWLED